MRGGVPWWYGTCSSGIAGQAAAGGIHRARIENIAGMAGVESRCLKASEAEITMARQNLTSMFGEFEKYASDVAIVQRRGQRREAWTYKKLANMAAAFALELKGRGVLTGERVMLWGPNSAEWMGAFWGCLLRGAVVVPVDDGATRDFAERVAREAGVRLAVCSREKSLGNYGGRTLVLEDLADTLARAHVSEQGHVPGDSLPPFYEHLADEEITRGHVAQILFTSGTTGEPRGVVLTHGNFLANLEPLEKGMEPYRKYERWMHPLRFVTLVPLSHVFGQFMGLLVPPLLGATIVFERAANGAEILRTIKRERATALIAVPKMLDGVRAGIEREFSVRCGISWVKERWQKADGRKFLRRAWIFRKVHGRSGWKFWAIISGGAALSSETEEFFSRMGYAVVQGYGMTETASLVSLNHPFRAARGSIGKVLPGREFRLAEDGEILVRGESVSSGYWENGAARKAAEGGDGWLRTGDVGQMDAEGNLRFRGRKKNVIVTPAGLNIYPEDLEVVLRKQAGVRDAVVAAVEHGGNAEACAVLLLENFLMAGETKNGAAKAAVEKANAALSDYQRIRSWVIWPGEDFPRTATGKARSGVIAARVPELLGEMSSARGISAAIAATGVTGSAVEGIVGKIARGGSGAGELERELNLSSLDRVELMSALEERFQVELNESAFSEAKTIADVEKLLSEPAAPRREYAYPRWAQWWMVRWARMAVYYALVWPATQILGHPKILGRENLKGVRGPVLVVSNHITRRADMGLILAALPGKLRQRLATAMGGETMREMRSPPERWFFVKRFGYWMGYWLVTALFNVFPLPQFSGFRESFRFAGESVDRGYSVLVFPEGEVNNSEDGRMAKFQAGIGVLAENLGVPIVPMKLEGVWQMKREGRRLARWGEITVKIGKPVRFAAGTPPEEIVLDLEKIVQGL